MEHKPDIQTLLSVFAIIREHGEQQSDQSYQLNGVTALSDLDGYHVVLKDDAVRLDINFHNTHQYQYEHRQQLERFVSRLETIAEQYG
ncbi:MAG: DUF3081 family protein [Pseudomonadota bacterium]|nr:hypothetical protein [Pseudomonadales bacterium]MDY6919945.1 DUF3081 family protein [Pseudomonadota bacterium]|tara:strand:- start:122 stop:385 length:264 start_codon:yes stop_codon:yes gene_type:complete